MKKEVWEYVSQISWQNIIEWSTCVYSWEEFPIFEQEKNILDTLWMPLPIISPDMRRLQLYMMRNERTFYKRSCDMTGKSILSIYPPEYPSKVFHFSEYISDKWSGFDYWKDLDFDWSISQQISDFYRSIPKRSLNIDAENSMENCDYSNYGTSSKDCYMSQVPTFSQNCYYSYTPFQSTYNIDTHLNEKCEISYESSFCMNSYQIFYSQYLEDSRDCWWCYDCIWIQNCIGCVWLHSKQYYILNQELTQREYEYKLKVILSSYKNLKTFQDEFDTFKSNFPKKALHNKLSENVQGNIIRYSKKTLNCFNVVDLQDSLHTQHSGIDSTSLLSCEYGGLNSWNVYHSIWFNHSIESAYISFTSAQRSYYLHDNTSVDDSMLCSGLQNQRYCIFNKQYSQEEYAVFSKKVIEMMKQEWIWGNWFLSEMLLFPYNDSKAYEQYPPQKIVYGSRDTKGAREWELNPKGRGTVYVLDPEAYISKAYLDFWGDKSLNILWRTQDNNIDISPSAKIIEADFLPEIHNIEAHVSDIIIQCKDTGRPFRVIAQELDFYKKYSLPLPRYHPDVRFQKRFQQFPKNTLHLRTCDGCWEQILSVWESESVVCESCYAK